MSGHSKWHKVKRQKAIADPKKGKLFGQLSKNIQVAAKEGGANPTMNIALRKAIADAKAANLPKDKIDNAINKGAGISDGNQLEDMQLEGYGPGGVALLIKASSDNRNRTVSEVRHILSKHGGSLGEPGSAAYVFGDDPYNPSFKAPLDSSSKRQLETILELLEENEDVLQVFHNAE